MKFLAVIPARYGSTRFPGKPLADILGKPMVQHVYERSRQVLETLIATDDDRIYQRVLQFGGNVVMTAMDHPSGTDRCAEAVTLWEQKTGNHYEIILNIQGDEPLIEPGQIRELLDCFRSGDVRIATLIRKITDPGDLENPGIPKVVAGKSGRALYFSRSTIPYLRNIAPGQWADNHTFYKHIGMYGFRKEVLMEITRLEPTPLEQAESLEQLRWLENGYPVTVKESRFDNDMVDTQEDLAKIVRRLS